MLVITKLLLGGRKCADDSSQGVCDGMTYEVKDFLSYSFVGANPPAGD
jgi:hypothetical protein